MSFKKSIKFILILIVAFLISFFIYKKLDDDLIDLSSSWKSELKILGKGTFSQKDDLKIPLILKKYEEACEDVENKKNLKFNFLTTWDEWSKNNQNLILHILNIFTKSPHYFANEGVGPYLEDLNEFYKMAEVIDYHICALKLKGSLQESNQIISQLVFNLMKQLNSAQPAKYQLWVLQTLYIYLNEEKLFVQDLKIRESLRAQIANIKQEDLFLKSKQFSSLVIFNSLSKFKIQGWAEITTWLPALLIHENKLLNQMANYEIGQAFTKPNPQAPWSDVSNLSALYFTLYVNSLEESWRSIPEELSNLKKIAGL